MTTLTIQDIDSLLDSILNTSSIVTPDILFNVLLPSQDADLRNIIESSIVDLDKQFGDNNGVLDIGDYNLLVKAIKSNPLVCASFFIVLSSDIVHIYKSATKSGTVFKSKADFVFSVILYIVLRSILIKDKTKDFIVDNKQFVYILVSELYSAYTYFVVTDKGLDKLNAKIYSCYLSVCKSKTIAKNTAVVKAEMKKQVSV